MLPPTTPTKGFPSFLVFTGISISLLLEIKKAKKNASNTHEDDLPNILHLNPFCPGFVAKIAAEFSIWGKFLCERTITTNQDTVIKLDSC